ncbi:MAG TPA: methyltransferase domain-containing protein [Bryobacteraceae bacterium]|nr:methyltransferase domain-containing protein [Bryobacteraceae bacterium]
MGRFESTVGFYDRYREPYPAEFFAEVAGRLGFQGMERLLDIACGPAPLAIGFAPYVRSAAGVDPEPSMLAAARRLAGEAGVQVELIESRLEDLPVQAGVFQIATIGRALHWLDREAALPVLERVIVSGGYMLVCGALSIYGPENPWAKAFHDLRHAWSEDPSDRRYRVDVDAWFMDSPFQKLEEISVTYRQSVALESLIGRALSMSTTSPAVLGERRAEFEAALRAALEPFAENGILAEEVRARAQVFRRSPLKID